jgi:hypothetical protein
VLFKELLDESQLCRVFTARDQSEGREMRGIMKKLQWKPSVELLHLENAVLGTPQ